MNYSKRNEVLNYAHIDNDKIILCIHFGSQADLVDLFACICTKLGITPVHAPHHHRRHDRPQSPLSNAGNKNIIDEHNHHQQKQQKKQDQPMQLQRTGPSTPPTQMVPDHQDHQVLEQKQQCWYNPVVVNLIQHTFVSRLVPKISNRLSGFTVNTKSDFNL